MQGIEKSSLAAEGMDVEGGEGDGDPVADELPRPPLRLCAEGDRGSSDAAGGSGAASSSGINLPMTGGGDRVPKEPKNKLVCMECKVPVRLMQHFLLLDGGHTGCAAEWEGAIWGHCEPCSWLIASDFKRQQ